MREPINEQSLDKQNAEIYSVQADKRLQIGNDSNNYIYDGYKIHERFDPEGLPFADCIVRLFA